MSFRLLVKLPDVFWCFVMFHCWRSLLRANKKCWFNCGQLNSVLHGHIYPLTAFTLAGFIRLSLPQLHKPLKMNCTALTCIQTSADRYERCSASIGPCPRVWSSGASLGTFKTMLISPLLCCRRQLSWALEQYSQNGSLLFSAQCKPWGWPWHITRKYQLIIHLKMCTVCVRSSSETGHLTSIHMPAL